jgi:hypothetical protein
MKSLACLRRDESRPAAENRREVSFARRAPVGHQHFGIGLEQCRKGEKQLGGCAGSNKDPFRWNGDGKALHVLAWGGLAQLIDSRCGLVTLNEPAL